MFEVALIRSMSVPVSRTRTLIVCVPDEEKVNRRGVPTLGTRELKMFHVYPDPKTPPPSCQLVSKIWSAFPSTL